jgi:glycosyltransferase involved in cell wall biosynthesis
MRILRIINTMNPSYGGPCQGIRNSIPELGRQGVVNEVVCLDDPSDASKWKDPFVIHALGKSKGPWQYSKQLSSWLAEFMHTYDVIIIHGLWLYHSYAAWKVFKRLHTENTKLSPKIYLMPHGMLDPYFQKDKGRRLKAIRNVIYWKLIESKVVNGVDGVLFTCEQELLLARTTFPNYKPKKELNIGYGVQPPPSSGSLNGSAEFLKKFSLEGVDYILFLSRIHKKKGTDLLIEAYLKLKAESTGLPKLVIAGPGLNSPFGEELARLCDNDPDIVFTDMLVGKDKWSAFYNARFFVLPSHQENFGIAVVESLACGVPVLITNQINIWREIVDNGGGMVANDDREGIYSLLKKSVAIDELEYPGLRERAFNTYREYFSIDKAAKRMKDLFERELT